jgi:hypothetical protein
MDSTLPCIALGGWWALVLLVLGTSHFVFVAYRRSLLIAAALELPLHTACAWVLLAARRGMGCGVVDPPPRSSQATGICFFQMGVRG